VIHILIIISLLQVAALYQNHPDLLEGFIHFLPEATTAASTHAFARNSMFRDRSSAMPTLRRVHVEKGLSSVLMALSVVKGMPKELN